MQVLADANRKINTALHRNLPPTRAMGVARRSRPYVAVA